MLNVQAWIDDYTWSRFCVMWRLVGNEILQAGG